jgi:putative addiction module killer protein
MPVFERVLEYYTVPNGSAPFRKWFDSLRDRTVRQIIDVRLARLRCGLFGDCEPVGDGVMELRIHIPSGVRIYFAQRDQKIILLLCGGIKRTQYRDIAKSKSYWSDYKMRFL